MTRACPQHLSGLDWYASCSILRKSFWGWYRDVMSDDNHSEAPDAGLPIGERLQRAAGVRLLEYAAEALLSELRPYKLAKSAGVSKDAAYRAFRGGAVEAFEAIAELGENPEWGGYHRGEEMMLEAVQAELVQISEEGEELDHDERQRRLLVAALTANVENMFASKAFPLGWLLTAISITSHPLWADEKAAPDEKGRELAEIARSSRKRFYDYMTDRQLPVLQNAMSELGVRPKPGYTARKVVMLQHALLDGCAHRMAVDPSAFTPREVAEAVFHLGVSLGIPGGLDDPRLPDDPELRATFDTALVAAEKVARDGHSVTVADLIDLSPDEHRNALRSIFDTDASLVDSLVRRVVAGGGLDHVSSDGPLDAADPIVDRSLLYLRETLERLTDFADAAPAAVEQVRAASSLCHGQERFVDDETIFGVIHAAYREVVAAVIGEPVTANATLKDLIDLACSGRPGKVGIDALFQLLRRRAGAALDAASNLP